MHASPAIASLLFRQMNGFVNCEIISLNCTERVFNWNLDEY